MLIRLVLAIRNKSLQTYVEGRFQEADIRVENYSHVKTSWQNVIRSCGDIIVISESLIPPKTEYSISMLNELPETPTTVVLHDSDSSEEHAKLVAAGADVVLYSGISRKSLIEAIESTVESRRQFVQKNRLNARGHTSPKIIDFTSESKSMQIFMEEVWKIIPSNSPLLLLGETGVGKEHLAKAIHSESPRSAGPFVAVNTVALPEHLLESELFGHEKGAFTGAVERKLGRFERAHGGTLFLDEIGDFSLNLQVKLLRVIQFKEFERVGGLETIKTNVRIVVATHKNLEEQIKEGFFREDLYYRINVFPIYMPPLRDRKDDIMLLADYFLEKTAAENNKDISRISTPAIEMLTRYHWPGNIRELENCIERAVLLCNDDVIRSEHLPPSLQMIKKDEAVAKRSLTEIIENKERELIVDALKKFDGKQRKTANELGISERILGYKINKYNINPKYI